MYVRTHSCTDTHNILPSRTEKNEGNRRMKMAGSSWHYGSEKIVSEVLDVSE
jgi:hypothetical protein